MKRQYSLVEGYNKSNDYGKSHKRKRLHKSESKEDAKPNSIGSFSSITTKYNNIYK